MNYQNQTAVLATQHRKEKIISRPFAKALALNIVVPVDLNTDVLGTFTGEIPRKDNMQITAIKKAKMGMALMQLPLGLASEGSFGPHPAMPWLPCDEELLVFIDEIRQFTLVEKIISFKTNYAHCQLKVHDDPNEFLKKIGFPKHAVIVRSKENHSFLFKGINDYTHLTQAIHACRQHDKMGEVQLETDMRAHVNPTRLSVIRQLAFRLARRLQATCPQCSLPGWGKVKVIKGLLCENCQLPTELIKNEIYGCAKCDYQEIRPRADKLLCAEARYCHYCNP